MTIYYCKKCSSKLITTFGNEIKFEESCTGCAKEISDTSRIEIIE